MARLIGLVSFRVCISVDNVEWLKSFRANIGNSRVNLRPRDLLIWKNKFKVSSPLRAILK